IGEEDKTMALKNFTLIPALALMLAPAAAFADAIPVANPSFETLPSGGLNNFCGGSCAFSTGLAIPGWNTTGSQTGQWITGGFDGNPPAIAALTQGPTNPKLRTI